MPPTPRIIPLFDCAPAPVGSERFDNLYAESGVVIERIVSSGSQPAQIYCQPQDEWVLLLRGNAELRMLGDVIKLESGDSLSIPAHTEHEVLSTSENAMWLAVHIHRASST
jgi:cupin 2 domain-containing protein